MKNKNMHKKFLLLLIFLFSFNSFVFAGGGDSGGATGGTADPGKSVNTDGGEKADFSGDSSGNSNANTGVSDSNSQAKADSYMAGQDGDLATSIAAMQLAGFTSSEIANAAQNEGYSMRGDAESGYTVSCVNGIEVGLAGTGSQSSAGNNDGGWGGNDTGGGDIVTTIYIPPTTSGCTNGATNFPACTIQPGTCTNGAVNPTACDLCRAGSTWNGTRCTCNNQAYNPPACNLCLPGSVMQNNICVCANGATNPSACNICPDRSSMVNGVCTCSNNADVFQQCNVCRSGQVFDNNGVCRDACNTTNVCGQTKQGYFSGGKCELVTTNGANPNESCIINLTPSTSRVNPNGSVEFSWSLANLPAGVRSVCGFVDLTTPNAPRQIPGLQNLSPQTDRIRINNIQVSTRFCLVCQFYSLTNSSELLGEAVKHQWVRVIRIGEN